MEKNREAYLRPLFWQHGESHEVLEDEIEQMYQNKIRGFIIESRPHPDFLGESWWSDLDFIIGEAKKRQMEIWLFDDSAYPSGYGAGKIKELYPQHLKVYLREYHIDAVGPMKEACFYIDPWLKDGEELLAVTAVKRKDKAEKIIDSEMLDLTDKIENGRLYWPVPKGDYRIFLFVKTRLGGEEWTKDYVNPISKEAVSAYISLIYEAHYKKYCEEFGKTIKGFFIDEPRFGNAEGYEHKLGEGGGYRECIGEQGIVLPYTNELFELLSEELGEDCKRLLPYLWYGEGAKSSDVRYSYMNVITKLFRDGFVGQIGNWCRDHQVKLIGHVVEDNGAHSRTGYGSGHFYRSLEGMDESGLDVVYQIWPERFEGRMESPFGYLDLQFYYWGLVKMASSFGHLDAKKEGKTMCEIFGAYGWQEGLKLMKWLTDHVCVRGVNRLVPHAFSPKEGDEDCPPHFYARGTNPQWKYFSIWSNYANRVCSMLSGGIHQCPALVVYHAEAEWGGKSQNFEVVAKALMEKQIDCDIAPIDYLVDPDRTKIKNGKVYINGECYEAIFMPYAQNIGKDWAKRILEFADSGVLIYLTEDYPEHIYFSRENDILMQIRNHKGIMVTNMFSPQKLLWEQGVDSIRVNPCNQYLRLYHYMKEEKNMYFFTNESLFETIKTTVELPGRSRYFVYDAMEDKSYAVKQELGEDCTKVILELSPYESLFLIEEYEDLKQKEILEYRTDTERLSLIEIQFEPWKVTLANGEHSNEIYMESLVNISKPELFPEYAGDVLYETEFMMNSIPENGKIYLELGEVYECVTVKLNNKTIGTKICPPYCFNINKAIEKKNLLQVTVTNTLSKAMSDNIFDRYMAQEPSGMLGPVRIMLKKGDINEEVE